MSTRLTLSVALVLATLGFVACGSNNNGAGDANGPRAPGSRPCQILPGPEQRHRGRRGPDRARHGQRQRRKAGTGNGKGNRGMGWAAAVLPTPAVASRHTRRPAG